MSPVLSANIGRFGCVVLPSLSAVASAASVSDDSAYMACILAVPSLSFGFGRLCFAQFGVSRLIGIVSVANPDGLDMYASPDDTRNDSAPKKNTQEKYQRSFEGSILFSCIIHLEPRACLSTTQGTNAVWFRKSEASSNFFKFAARTITSAMESPILPWWTTVRG